MIHDNLQSVDHFLLVVFLPLSPSVKICQVALPLFCRQKEMQPQLQVQMAGGQRLGQFAVECGDIDYTVDL